MKRQMIRLALALVLVLLTALAARLWTMSYDGSPDPQARFEIEGTHLKRDRSNFWLEVHLKKSGSKDHDLRQPVRLITADGIKHEPADTVFAGSQEKGFTEIWFKFWLEDRQVEGPISLQLNGGELRIKINQGMPKLDKKGEAVIKSADWRKSWLGF